jgi:CheY-like chemotaxis protein
MVQNEKTILYVDDDEDDQEFLMEAIKEVNPNVEVVLAGNGIEALDYLDTVKDTFKLPNLIILDINMPYLNGKETFERIKNDLRLQNIPVIFFTSSENPNDRALFNKLGIEYITKPSNASYLNKIARHMLKVCD